MELSKKMQDRIKAYENLGYRVSKIESGEVVLIKWQLELLIIPALLILGALIATGAFLWFLLILPIAYLPGLRRKATIKEIEGKIEEA